MAVRYTVTTETGIKYTRNSRGHAAPRYLFAVVSHPSSASSKVSYAARRELAQGQLNALRSRVWEDSQRNRDAGRVGQIYPDAKIYPVTAEVLPEPKARVAKSPLHPSSSAADFARS